MANEPLPMLSFQVDDIKSSTPNPGLILGRLLAWYGSSTRGYNKVGAIGVKEELLTIAAAATSTTVSTSLLPANSLILAVIGRVTVVIPTATSFAVGDATTAARFATGIAVAAGTTFVGITHWSGAITTLAAGPSQAANAAIVVTPAGGTPANNSGRLALQTIYLQFTPPTA